MPRMSSSQIVARKKQQNMSKRELSGKITKKNQTHTHTAHSAVHFVKSRYISFFIPHWVMSLVVVLFFLLSFARSCFFSAAAVFSFWSVFLCVLTCTMYILKTITVLVNNNISCSFYYTVFLLVCLLTSLWSLVLAPAFFAALYLCTFWVWISNISTNYYFPFDGCGVSLYIFFEYTAFVAREQCCVRCNFCFIVVSILLFLALESCLFAHFLALWTFIQWCLFLAIFGKTCKVKKWRHVIECLQKMKQYSKD